MIALKFFAFFALICAIHGQTDKDLVFKLLKCLRKVIIRGVPEIGIPPHDPLQVNHNFTWTGDIIIASATLDIFEVEWHGIPWWRLSAEQLSNDSDSHAVFNYTLLWDEFFIVTKYTLETKVGFIPTHLEGHLNITLENTFWTGQIDFAKPGFNQTEGIESLSLDWKAEKVHFDFTGLGVLNNVISGTLADLLKSFLDKGAIGDKLALAFKDRLNTAWFAQNERIDSVLEFCKKH